VACPVVQYFSIEKVISLEKSNFNIPKNPYQQEGLQVGKGWGGGGIAIQ
jgi:hypothetical protein